MQLSPKQQILKLIDRHDDILIITREHPSGDSFGSLLGLYLALKARNKKTTIISPTEPSQLYQFLPAFQEIKKHINSSNEFIISVNLDETKTKNIDYNVQGNTLNIFIDQDQPLLTPKKVKSKGYNIPYNLVITVDCPDLEDLGKVYTQHNAFFYDTPIINIDSNTSNEHYGQVNLVDIASSSTAELIVPLAIELTSNKMGKDIATCLLTGIISNTNSFQAPATTPKSFSIAAQLLGYGADRQKIIQHLYKTRQLEQVRLWGKILSTLQHIPDRKMLWTKLKTIDHADSLIKELLNGIADINVIVLFVEKGDKSLQGTVYSTKYIDSLKLTRALGGSGNTNKASFTATHSTPEEIIAKLGE